MKNLKIKVKNDVTNFYFFLILFIYVCVSKYFLFGFVSR